MPIDTAVLVPGKSKAADISMLAVAMAAGPEKDETERTSLSTVRDDRGEVFRRADGRHADPDLNREPIPLQGRGMKVFDRVRRCAFWPLALLWLPGGVVAQAAARFPPVRYSAADPAMLAEAAASLAVLVPCGLPLSLACRRLWRIGYRRSALWTWIALGAVSVAGAMAAGLLGPLAIVTCAVALSLPAWSASLWLSRMG